MDDSAGAWSTANQLPRIAPWRSIASSAYSEQVGTKKRHEMG